MRVHSTSTLSIMPDSTPLSFVDQLSDVAREELESTARHRHYQRGDVLFHEEDDGSQVMLLQKGQVKVWVSAPSGREVILHVFDPGVLLGEIAAVDGGLRSASVSALTEVDVLVLPQAQFIDFLQRHAEAATALLKLLVAKLRGATRRQLEFGTADALGRLCRALVELAAKYSEHRDGVRTFQLPLTQQDLGSFSGLSREAIVKGLATLRALEWIRTTGRTVELLDEGALAARASDG
jgi:CRP/FNR family transcriptional regulator, cyclic AMP receptor protein